MEIFEDFFLPSSAREKWRSQAKKSLFLVAIAAKGAAILDSPCALGRLLNTQNQLIPEPLS
jgi:hypothetical protein